jgi:4-diphosphocytidyl-2-C-methyl-D-erythritol kinase
VSASARLRAQAKINVGLRILAREASGYHQLETVFQRLDLSDEVRVELTSGSRTIACTGPRMPETGLGPDEQNLAWRAATAYLDAMGSSRGFRIEIVKHIPTGGGLGGGSADAGAVLRVLHHLLGAGSPVNLLGLAGLLGADVPFLTQDSTVLALGWGRGERLLALPPLPASPCVLVAAPFGVNTGAAFGWLAEAGIPAPGAAVSPPDAYASWERIKSNAANDFEVVVLNHLPALAAAFEALSASAGPEHLVRMSGSGATLFALGSPGAALRTAVSGLPEGFTVISSATATRVSRVVEE